MMYEEVRSLVAEAQAEFERLELPHEAMEPIRMASAALEQVERLVHDSSSAKEPADDE